MHIYSVCLILIGIGVGVAGSNTANTTCTMEMFGGDFNAYMACKAQFALQSNWWPSPIAGLFSYQVRNRNQFQIFIYFFTGTRSTTRKQNRQKYIW